uniref:Ribosomal protein S11 n=1 Tax=Gredgaria maugeana TaxID=2007213 RepID=UPI0022FDA8A9|nr:Ribosomal protein S11 [Gredgaria maugeana]WAX04213.1 Ribosomal protein S11 [Gredgaria maugeana]
MQVYFLVCLFTQNNIFLTITNFKGEVIIWKSIGSFKIKGLKKLTNTFFKNFIFLHLSNFKFCSNIKFHIKLKGFNKSKKTFIRLLFIFLKELILSCLDDSKKPLNGCKLKKKRRL